MQSPLSHQLFPMHVWKGSAHGSIVLSRDWGILIQNHAPTRTVGDLQNLIHKVSNIYDKAMTMSWQMISRDDVSYFKKKKRQNKPLRDALALQ